VVKEKLRKSLVISDLEKVKEISWRQKSGALRLKEGDKCAKFFRWVVYSNRRNNSIEALSING
jgi:hypothetical protein